MNLITNITSKVSGDPVGQVQVDKVVGLVQDLATQWKTKTVATAPKWWQFWKKRVTITKYKVIA